MDWIHMIEIVIASITSIVVALIGAGMFRKAARKKEKNKNHEQLLYQIKKDEVIHLSLKEMKTKYKSDRVYIWQFHNGGTYYTSAPMQKMSITYERCTDGLERVTKRNQDILISKYSDYLNDVINNNVFYAKINDMPSLSLRSVAHSFGTKSHCSAPIYDKNSNLVGLLSMDWGLNDVPEKFLKKDGNFTQDFIDEYAKNCDSLDTDL